MVKACYAAPCMRISLDGVEMGDIYPSRGVRQGCPLSPLLFALCIEPLHHQLRTGRGLMGAELPRRIDGVAVARVRAWLFADDITLFPQDEKDCKKMLGVIRAFGYASGSKLNVSKTQVCLALPS